MNPLESLQYRVAAARGAYWRGYQAGLISAAVAFTFVLLLARYDLAQIADRALRLAGV